MTAVVHRTRAHHAVHRATVAAAVPALPALSGRWFVSVLVAGGLSLAGLGVHGVLSGPGDVPASAAGTGPAPPHRSIKAHPGDTLWSIAERHRGDVPIQRFVDALVDLNGGATRIDAGQLVRLP